MAIHFKLCKFCPNISQNFIILQQGEKPLENAFTFFKTDENPDKMHLPFENRRAKMEHIKGFETLAAVYLMYWESGRVFFFFFFLAYTCLNLRQS